MPLIPRRPAAFIAIAFALAASACSPQPTEVIAGADGLQSEVVIRDHDASPEEAPTTTQLPAEVPGESTTTALQPATSIVAMPGTTPTPECVALEMFLLQDLDELDNGTDEEAYAAIEAVLFPAAPSTEPAWRQLIAQSDNPDPELDEEERLDAFVRIMAEVDRTTMRNCGLPFFSAVFALDPVQKFCAVSATINDEDDPNAEYDDNGCQEQVAPVALPCFAATQPDRERYEVASYAAVDCETDERVRLTLLGTWDPIDDESFGTLPTTPSPSTTIAPPTTQAPMPLPPTTGPPTEYMTTTTMP